RRGHQAKRGRKKQMSCKKDSLPAMMVIVNINRKQEGERWTLLSKINERGGKTASFDSDRLMASLARLEGDNALTEIR
ncbi:hypothetical protein, partial [Geobacillus stearothermophilus]|uniref:hypothetical protein n=1 Tax=Geobacillus stearothermophilus TaxID=1422 RepID=UPI0039C2E53F